MTTNAATIEAARIRVEIPDAATREAIAALLADQYWCHGTPASRLARAFEFATVVVVARDADEGVVGAARALSDRARRAMIFDVIVAPHARGRGIGAGMMQALLGHEALAEVDVIWLATRDAMGLYARFGFVALAHANPRPDGNVEMVRRRAV